MGAEGQYNPGQRAYVFTEVEDSLSFTINATSENPVINLAIVIKNWEEKLPAIISVNNKEVESRQGTFRDIDGTNTMVIWIEQDTDKPIHLQLTKGQK